MAWEVDASYDQVVIQTGFSPEPGLILWPPEYPGNPKTSEVEEEAS